MKNKMKKHLAGLLTIVMMFSLLSSLPQGLVAKAAENTPQDEYFIYFDANTGKLYKETGEFEPDKWEADTSEEYTDNTITCSGNQLILNNFYLFPANNSAAIVVKGDAIIQVIGENQIIYESGTTMPYPWGARYGIYAYDSLSFTGTGSLEATARTNGIFVAENLTIQDASITSTGNYEGITAKKITIHSGSLTGKTYRFWPDLIEGGMGQSIGVHATEMIYFNGGTLIGDSTGPSVGHRSGIVTPNINMNDNAIAADGDNNTDIQFVESAGVFLPSQYATGPNNSDKTCSVVKLTTKVTGIDSTTSSTLSMVIGESVDLNVKVVPEAASNQTIKYSSTDDSIVSVDENGTVTAKKEGAASITATTQEGNYTKVFTITVSKADGPAAPTGITAVSPTTAGGSDGKMVGVNNTMEYSTNKAFTDAKDCIGNEVTGLPAGTYYVRVKETDTTKAGADVAVTVPQAGSSPSGNGNTSQPSPSPSGNGDTSQPGSSTSGNGNASQTEQSVMDNLGVTNDTAKQILNEAAKLGVSQDTLRITDASITSSKSDADLKGSTFGLLKARATKLKKNAITIKWSKVKNADGYIVYGNKCGAKNSYKKLKTIKKNSTCKFTQKKLKKGTYYKYLVIAYKKIAGTTVTIAAAKTVHATTTGGKYGVAKAVKVNKTKVTLARSKTFKIKASEIKKDKKKKIRQHRKIKYESSNTKIASVNGKGIVKAKKKGSCDIYVYAQNGVYKKIKITVK